MSEGDGELQLALRRSLHPHDVDVDLDQASHLEATDTRGSRPAAPAASVRGAVINLEAAGQGAASSGSSAGPVRDDPPCGVCKRDEGASGIAVGPPSAALRGPWRRETLGHLAIWEDLVGSGGLGQVPSAEALDQAASRPKR